jgi:hypothetical protein
MKARDLAALEAENGYRAMDARAQDVGAGDGTRGPACLNLHQPENNLALESLLSDGDIGMWSEDTVYFADKSLIGTRQRRISSEESKLSPRETKMLAPRLGSYSEIKDVPRSH